MFSQILISSHTCRHFRLNYAPEIISRKANLSNVLTHPNDRICICVGEGYAQSLYTGYITDICLMRFLAKRCRISDLLTHHNLTPPIYHIQSQLLGGFLVLFLPLVSHNVAR
jgi:hypothetical protein